MIRNYDEFINENNNLSLNKRILRWYNKVKKMVNSSFFINKLNLNIIPYYKLYKILFENSDLNLNEYKINLLIVSSFSRLLKDNIDNIENLENEIRKNNVHELYISSFNILKVTYSLLLIIKSSYKNFDILFDNKHIINIIKDYINNKNIDIYEYNSLFENEEYMNIIKFVKKFDN